MLVYRNIVENVLRFTTEYGNLANTPLDKLVTRQRGGYGVALFNRIAHCSGDEQFCYIL